MNTIRKLTRRQTLTWALSFGIASLGAATLSGCGGGGTNPSTTDSEDLADPPSFVDQENQPDIIDDQGNVDETSLETRSRQAFNVEAQPWILDSRSKRKWRATGPSTLIPGVMRGGRKVTLAVTDVADVNGNTGIRLGYKKANGSWKRSVLYGKDLNALGVTSTTPITLRLSWNDLNPLEWGKKLFKKIYNKLMAALQSFGQELSARLSDVVKKVLEEARGALKNAIQYLADIGDHNIVATFLVTLVTSAGSAKERLIAAMKATAQAAAVNALVAAIAAA